MRAVAKEAAGSMLTRVGARVTPARIEVLAVLLEAERALAHHEVESRLGRSGHVDRVTVYRVLDWLTRQRLAHKIAGEDRVWRYNAAEHAQTHAHAHFQCARCGTVICLDGETHEASKLQLPRGFVLHEVVLTAKGLCATCVHAAGASRQRDKHMHHAKINTSH